MKKKCFNKLNTDLIIGFTFAKEGFSIYLNIRKNRKTNWKIRLKILLIWKFLSLKLLFKK